LHMVQLMPLPSSNPVISCLIKIQTGFDTGLPRLSWKRGHKTSVLLLVVVAVAAVVLVVVKG